MGKWKPNDYFKEIAIHHILLQHTEAKPAFFREFSSSRILIDNSDFLLKMRKSGDNILVSIFNGEKRYAEDIDNNTRINTGSILLLKKVKDITGVDAAREELDGIWEDINAKIKQDIRTSAIQLFGYSAQAVPIGMIGDSYFGLAFFISYADVYCHFPNTARWI